MKSASRRMLGLPALAALIGPPVALGAAAQSGPADAARPVDAASPAERARAPVVAEPAIAASRPATGDREPADGASADRPVDPVEAAIAASRNPAPWLKWGADLRLRELYINNGVRLDKADPDHEIHRQRYRPRFWTTVSPHPIVDVNMRLIWEANGSCKPDSYDDWDPGEVFFDIFNFAMKQPGGLPFTVTGGRQEIALGDRWLVFEGNPLDGSRSIFFDAVRWTTELEAIQTRIETIYLETDAEGEGWVGMLKSRDFSATTGLPGRRYMTEQDERGAIVWIENRSLRRTEIDGYFIYKHNDRTLATGSDADIYTFGLRGVHDLDEHWQIRGDLAGQFGHRNDAGLCALGSNNRLSYDFKAGTVTGCGWITSTCRAIVPEPAPTRPSIRCLSIFRENRPYQVRGPIRLLAEAGIDILTMALADTRQFGILRLIVDDREKAKTVLERAGCAVTVTEVVAIEVLDQTRGLEQMLAGVEKADLNIEYTPARSTWGPAPPGTQFDRFFLDRSSARGA